MEARDDALVIDGHVIPFHRTPDLRTLSPGGVDLTMDCTGHAETRPEVGRGRLVGASKVPMSGHSADATIVLGADDAAPDPAQRVVSTVP